MQSIISPLSFLFIPNLSSHEPSSLFSADNTLAGPGISYMSVEQKSGSSVSGVSSLSFSSPKKSSTLISINSFIFIYSYQ